MREWLLRLVEILLAHGGHVAELLVRTTAGKRAVIEIDDLRIDLMAQAADRGITVEVRRADDTDPLNFHSSGETLRDVISGRVLLDTAIADGRVHVRAPLMDLLAMHELVMRTLASAASSRALRELWAEFDAWWPRVDVPCLPVAAQLPKHGVLRHAVPVEVLRVQLDARPE
jgi:hypothetical protein